MHKLSVCWSVPDVCAGVESLSLYQMTHFWLSNEYIVMGGRYMYFRAGRPSVSSAYCMHEDVKLLGQSHWPWPHMKYMAGF